MKISFLIEESRFRLVNFEGLNPNLDSLDLKSKHSIGKGLKKVQMDSGIQLIIPSFWRLSQGSFVPLLQKAK